MLRVKYSLHMMTKSPYLNQVDYKIWDLLQQRVYTRKIQHVEELRQCIIEEWELLDQRVIDNAVKQWRRRLCKRRPFRAIIVEILTEYVILYFQQLLCK